MELVLIGVLIVLNAVFVMSEMALVAARKPRLQGRADRGSRGAAAALALVEHPTRFLSTTQVGITLIGILMGAFGEGAIAHRLQPHLERVPVLAPHAHLVGFALTILALTYVSLVFSELVPKRLAQGHPEPIASALAIPMNWLSVGAAPLVWLLTRSTELALRLIPVREGHDDQAAEEEVKALMATGAQSGVFHQAEQAIVERVFTLGDQRAKSIMVPRTDIDFLDVHDGPQRVRVAIATSSHSHFPVCDGSLDKLVGYVHVKDVVKHTLVADELDLRAIARAPLFVPESATAIKTLEKFRATGSHIAFVLDEYGAVVGLLTLTDIVTGLLGDISPSGAPDDPMVVRRADGSLLLDGMLPVEELKDLMGVDDLPKESAGGFDTLGGFVLTYLGRIPATGDAFAFDGFTFEVMDMDRTRVDRVLLTIAPQAADEPGDAI